jgi:hypothetical protein
VAIYGIKSLRIYRKIISTGLVLCFAISSTSWAGGIDIQKLKRKGTQYSKELRYFLETGLVSTRATAIEMQLENFDKSLMAYREARHIDRNAALKAAQESYEKFQTEFKIISEILRELVNKYQAAYNERSGEAFPDTNTKEKTLATLEVGRQDESRALAAFNNRNYIYSSHVYLRSVKHYHQAFEMRKWPQLANINHAGKKSPKSKKKKSTSDIR